MNGGARRLAALLALVAVAAALAWSARPQAETPADRVERISAELRCTVCQGLSVRDSPSETARQMRGLVAQRVGEGRTDAEIREEFRRSYGDWVLLAPPLLDARGLAWLVPLAALGAGALLAYGRLRRAGAPAAREGPEPTAAQLAALRDRVRREDAEA